MYLSPFTDGLDLYFINDTPQVDGTGGLRAQFRTNRPRTDRVAAYRPGPDVVLTCRLTGRSGRGANNILFDLTQDCKQFSSVTYILKLSLIKLTLVLILYIVVRGNAFICRVWLTLQDLAYSYNCTSILHVRIAQEQTLSR